MINIIEQSVSAINITPEQVKTILNWDFFENGKLEIDLDGAMIEWDKEDNCIIASWTDRFDAYLGHRKVFDIGFIFGSKEYKDYFGMNEADYYQKIADYINGFFKLNDTVAFLPF